MKKGKKIIVVLLILLLLVVLLGFVVEYIRRTTIRAVIVKVSENSLLVYDGTLYNVGFTKKGDIGFKQGQEVLIFFEGSVMETAPAQPVGVRKIKIIKEKSDREISEQILRYAYNSKDNVKVTVNEFTPTGITFTIIDTNELPYDYSHSYRIEKKVKNSDYTGIGQKIGEDTKNSIAGYTRNRA